MRKILLIDRGGFHQLQEMFISTGQMQCAYLA